MPSQPTVAPDALVAVGTLADPTRRKIHDFVRGAGRPVSRDEVAAEMGMARQTAAYHLDRLADEGLVDVEFVRLSGRTGPGAGRPAKTYLPSGRDLEVTVPPRRYLLAARILLDAIKAGGVALGDMRAAARRVGAGIGAEGLDTALLETGYEPVTEEGEVRFRNCPFHALVDEDRSTTCVLNLALVEGMVEGSGDSRRPCLEPEDGYCCVRLRPA